MNPNRPKIEFVRPLFFTLTCMNARQVNVTNKGLPFLLTLLNRQLPSQPHWLHPEIQPNPNRERERKSERSVWSLLTLWWVIKKGERVWSSKLMGIDESQRVVVHPVLLPCSYVITFCLSLYSYIFITSQETEEQRACRHDGRLSSHYMAPPAPSFPLFLFLCFFPPISQFCLLLE